jgi:chromosome segregation protein
MLRLEKLEISGFKSFADRTSLVFGEGITGVVGPNGCGKSNIAEAISWVLGEQSAKNLRGGKMEDVIFSGARDRKPLGMAEVMLTMEAMADIAARDSDDASQDGDQSLNVEARYEEALVSAERAANAARQLVEEMAPPAPGENAPDSRTDGSEAASQPKSDLPQRPRSTRPPKRPRIVVSAGERVTVGRRLYRTGDSDYIMNGRACLLRDIQDLFAGTGLGGAHYAIIEQGRIGQILSSKPLDRRGLIEEAAGITKFKSRRRAAELKLESAKQNLTRLNDIISEVERQVNSLKRQAAKARRYKRLHDEMRSLQRLIFIADYYRLKEAAARIEADLEAAGIEQARIDSVLVEREAEYRAAAAEARQAEDSLTLLRERAAAIELQADRARNRLGFEEQQIRELTARTDDIGRGQQALTERLALLDTEAERRGGVLSSLQAELVAGQAGLIERENLYQEELGRRSAAETETERLRQQLLVEIGTTERLRNNRSNLEEALGRLDLKRSNLHAEMERAAARRDEVMSQNRQMVEETRTNHARMADLSRRIDECAAAASASRGSALGIQARVEEAQARRSAVSQRLATLEDLEIHRAYYSDAVQHVLSPEQAARINALGTLADFVDVEPQYERLIEGLFGRELQCVLVPTIDDALAGVEYLNSEGLGRGGFLVVGLHGGEGDPPNRETEFYVETGGHEHESEEGAVTDQISLPESIQRARFDEQDTAHASRFQLEVLRPIDLMGLRSEIKSVVERAFPDKCAASVAPNMEAALELSMENGWRTYVTFDGEQVVNGRLIVTAAPAGEKETTLLGIKREIKQLSDQAGELKVEEESLMAALGLARRQSEEIEADSEWLDKELRVCERAAAAQESQAEALLRDLERAEQHMRVVEAELALAAEERIHLEERLAQLAGELSAAEESRAGVQNALAASQLEFIRWREAVEIASEQLSAARASVAALVERTRAAQSEMRRIQNEAEELQSRINSNRLEMYESQTRIEQLTASRAEQAALLETLETDRIALAEEMSAGTTALASVRGRTDELEAMLAEVRQSSSAAHEARGQIEIERAKVLAESDHLAKSCFAELTVPLPELIANHEESAALEEASSGAAQAGVGQTTAENEVSAEGVAPSPETVTASPESEAAPPESGAANAAQVPETNGSGIDIEAAALRLDELRVKLDDLGPVNMMALEELKESEERFEFLSVQRRDILDSIKGTEDALAEIKKRSRERFRHAFQHINDNFREMFVELFGGGHGEMVLIDEDDVLESGIDLIAQPPGKRLQNVLLLSGGEKAMAALALVLAIFQYRPSPFCVLDEVDAPLDEMNVGRFSGKIVEMSRDTQFLVITHNKRTMESASALYGVTMEEPGVSRLVSVKFE